ncbi:c-type cytochrome [Blastopirellula sp. JC732]|uniref:C-type cytochrome n=1 Tax=Blastopirellula sediminis TaxID=2894196 RepID=A0A9X1MHM2_9BACT|nr:PVC-type heme-binding CxxCH protein [Blastopirellula sediminis]MCC9607934.1 c-type cytochrome [Blastopirellula sediminis]MCC9627273.1 c-type cytochrome [Blastopirellula sediminis]
MRSFAALSLCFAVAVCCSAEEFDFADQLPRVAPKQPAEALKTIQVAPGFRVEQAATEPNVVDPVAMAFDADGRMFVIEMRGYSEDDGLVLGRVRLLEDVDDDGVYEKSTVFAEGLSWPTAIACVRGGVLVGAAPDIYFLKDNNGDGVADERRVVYTGFGKTNVQGLMNTFLWGLDNRIHGATSSSGGVVKPVVDGQPQGEGVNLRGRDFAIDTAAMTITPTSGGAQHGMSFDDWGDKFVCSNSDHLQQVMYEDRYFSRNPYVAPPSSRRSIAADGPQADVYRTSPVEAWRVIRTRLRAEKIVPGVVEGGGRPAGYFTGATGVTIFRGDAWPSEFQGNAIVGDVGSNLVHRKRLIPNGVVYSGERIDEKSEFVSSSDIWFRPVQFSNAPDGSLYIADMYRETIEHPASLPPMIKRHLDLTSGRDRGRVYRVVGENYQRPKTLKMSQMTAIELAQLLADPISWRRETAARLLYERQDLSAVPVLKEMAAAGASPQARIQALYALAGLQSLDEKTLLTPLDDQHPRVRQQAIRLSEPLLAKSPALRQKEVQLVADSDPHVRYQLAFSLGEFPAAEKQAPLAKLAASDGNDPYFVAAIQSSVAEGAGALWANLAKSAQLSSGEKTLLLALAKQVGKQRRKEDIAAMVAALPQLSKSHADLVPLVIKEMAAGGDAALAAQIAAAVDGNGEAMLQRIYDQAVVVVKDEKAPLAARTAAMPTLRFRSLDEKLFAELLQPSQPPALQQAALQTLAHFSSSEAANLVLERWSAMSPSLRQSAFQVLAANPQGIASLLDAVQAGEIRTADLDMNVLNTLKSLQTPDIQARIDDLAKSTGKSDRDAIVAEYRPALEMTGDPERGEAVFVKNCSSCHQMNGKGHPIGPNLAAMKNRGAEAILTNVLNPNLEVNPQYMSYVCLTTDGRALTGIISNETATSITLLQGENKSETILRIDIDELRSTGQSLMPQDLEKQIDRQAMADLLRYLLDSK